MKKINIIFGLAIVTAFVAFVSGCTEDEKNYPEVRMFRPVLNEDLYAVNNTIIVNMGRLKRAVSYTIEVSRDTFQTLDYTVEVDTNYVVLDDALLGGDPLFWNTLYQIRATAHAADTQFDSKPSDLGSVRTERFPSILNAPASYDVIDTEARVTWTVSGAAVTEVVVFAGTDLKLTTPLATFTVDAGEQVAGEKFIDGLTPSTKYQVAIYSGETLRGWVDYTTLELDIDPAAPGVVDLRAETDPTALAIAVAGASADAIILLKRGSVFDMPTAGLDKNITIRAEQGFGKKQAMLVNTNGNWNIADGATIDYVRFVDLELRGNNFGGTYVFNPSSGNTIVGEILFENCYINTMRGIMRLRGSNAEVDNFRIIDCLVDSIGGYGIFTADTDGPTATTAHVNNFELKNSTFNRITAGITSRTSSQSIVIDGCTIHSFVQGGSGNYIFRYRGSEPEDEVVNGITITNTVIGNGWDTGGGDVAIRGFQGLEETSVQATNVFTCSTFAWQATYEIGTIPVGNYAGNPTTLWENPDNNNFNFKDTGFIGRYSVGDPRWRVKL